MGSLRIGKKEKAERLSGVGGVGIGFHARL